MGHEKVPHVSGLTGDRCSDTAVGARTEGLPEPRTSTTFPEIQYPTGQRGEGRTVCVCGHSKGL